MTAPERIDMTTAAPATAPALPAVPWRTATVIQGVRDVVPLDLLDRHPLFADARARLAHVAAAEAGYRAREATRAREHERTVAVWREATTAAALRGEDGPEPPAAFISGPGIDAFEGARHEVLDEVRATWQEHGARVVAEEVAALDNEGAADDSEAARLQAALREVEQRITARSTRREALRRAGARVTPPTAPPVVDDRRLNVIDHRPEDAPRHGPLADLARAARDAATGVRPSGLFRAR